MAQVTFDRVGKIFNDTVALRELNLTVKSGEFLSLLGPSGCGKTTSLRMLAGLDYPTSGTISIGDRVVNELPPAKRDIAMVFQSYALYPHMSVAQNIEYPLKKRGFPKAEREQKVRQAATLLQLEALMDRKPRQLSGGQQQRVALGRALVRDPAVFLLDEPLSNLDAKLRAHMRAELIQLHQRIGRTMVYVTHDQLEAMTMSDRIAVLSNGILQQCGSPDEVYNRPANVFVASFIGTPSMNFIDGILARSGDKVLVRGGGMTVNLPSHAIHQDVGRGEQAEVTIGVRPEDVLVAGEGAQANVKVVEPTGHENVVLFDLDGTEVVGRFGPDTRLKPKQPVTLSFRTSRLHVFARPGGRRLNTDIELLSDRVSDPRIA
jgi:multiple sugar transport system ATP-binding protein